MKKKSLRPGTSPKEWKKGLETLNLFWKSGCEPDDMERHFFLTWFALSDGRILQAVRDMGLHRNTFQNYLAKFRLARQTIRLRRLWQKLDDGKGAKTFNARMLAFYRQTTKTPTITPAQNEALIGLWKTGFPSKMLMPHFVLWGIRSGKSREWLRKKLDFSNRHLIRVLSRIAQPKSADAFWLAPLKPKAVELYLPRYRSRLKKRKMI
jgi:HAMP domain-containing protein